MVGVSFKISRAGSRYKAKAVEPQRPNVKSVDVGLICPTCKRHRTASTDGGSVPTCICNSSSNSTLDSITESTSDEANGAFRSSPASQKRKRSEVALIKMSGDIRGRLPLNRTLQISKDADASFSVRLFSDGFSIGRPIKGEKAAPPAHEVMDLMYPYNRTSENFLRALDGGWIPGDLLEDIPCKYSNGCVVCEVHDYRMNAPSSVDSSLPNPSDWMPVVYKVTLRPTTESIVKDVSSMVDENWTYNDLMEVESRILKNVWPELHLDPKPASHQSEQNASGRSGHNIFKHYRTHKGELMDRRLRLTATAKAVMKQGVPHSRPIQPSVGLAIPPMQFPPSPSSGMSTTPITPLGLEASGLNFDNKLSNLGKRDGRDVGDKLETKKPKQELLRDKVQLQVEKTAFKNEQKMMDQHLQDASNYQQFSHDKQQNLPASLSQPYLGCSDQDLKLASSSDHEDISEILMKHDIEFQNNANFDQQRLAELAKLGEEQENLVTEEQEPHQDPQMSSQRVLQQNFGKSQVLSSQSWQVLSPDDLLQRKKPSSPKMLPKADVRVSSQLLSNEISHMSPTAAHNAAVFRGSSTNPVIVPSLSSLAQPKDRLQTQAAVSSVSGPSESALALQALSRRRTNSLPKASTGIAGVASPGSNVTSGVISNSNSPSVSNMPHVGVVKSEGSLLAAGPRKEPVESFKVLLSMAPRYGLPTKRKKVEQLPDSKKTLPSWQLLSVALADNSNEDTKDPKRQRNMADLLVGGNVNVRKTRFLQFQRQTMQGTYFRRIRVRLVMCERSKDAMVEAVVQFGDDQDDETSNSVPHHVLPTMANAYAADLFAKQFCALMEKDGFELVEDQVQPSIARTNTPMNAATTARPMPAGASTLGSSLTQLSSPRALVNQHMPAMAAVGGMTGISPMQPSSPGALAGTRMPPPGSSSSRQISAGYLGQAGVSASSKPLTIDGAAGQLSAVQHPQQHQQPLVQRAQQLAVPPQLSQLNASNHNQAQQISPQMVANQGQLQQYLQQQQQQQQQRQQAPIQRRLMGMGSLGHMGNLGGVGIPVSGGTQGGLGNMVGINSMNNVVGISGMNNVSASMGGISGLGNVTQLPGIVAMGQNAGLGNLIGQQLRPGSLGPAQMQALSNKAHLTQGRTGRPVGTPNSTVRNPVDNLSGMNTSNQVHISAGLPMMGQSLRRVGIAPLPRAQVTSMGSPKVPSSNMTTVAGQGFYLNAQQLSSQQQLNLQQLNPLQQSSQQQLNAQQSQLTATQVNSQMQQQPPTLNPQAQLESQQPKNSQPSLNPQSLSNPQSQQVNPQGQVSSASQQQLASQQLNGPQLVVGGLGSLVGGPASPQLSSQNLSTVTSSSLDLPNANCGSSLTSTGQ